MTQRHYFIADPENIGHERVLKPDFFGQSFTFTTCGGLFSYEKPDAASILLLDVLKNTTPPLQGEILDLGCGYGLLGIVLAKTHAQNAAFTLSDVNEIACEYARRNLLANRVTAQVVHSDGFAQLPRAFHHITLNPPIHAGKETMYRLYQETAAHLHTGGSLYIVIQKKHGAESTLAYLQQIFHQVKILYKRKGHYIVQCTVEA